MWPSYTTNVGRFYSEMTLKKYLAIFMLLTFLFTWFLCIFAGNLNIYLLNTIIYLYLVYEEWKR